MNTAKNTATNTATKEISRSPRDVDARQATYIALQCVPGLFPDKLARLLSQLGSASALLQRALEHADSLRLKADVLSALQELARSPTTNKYHQGAIAVQATAQERGWQLLCIEDADYPALLHEISAPPPLIYLRGKPELLSLPQVAVVGSRKASPGGLRCAADIAAALSRAGMLVTSGLALGIDAASHRGALAADAATVAVIGTGLDVDYPRRNQALAAEIAERGLIVSEFLPGTRPLAQNFPRRNRIISGLSLGVLVVEAALRSGSLITAKFALEQNRDVFAVPGAIQNPMSAGCHALIKQGASLVSGADDIMQALALQLPAPGADTVVPAMVNAETEALLKAHHQVVTSVAFAPTTLESIAQASAVPVAELMPTLLALELAGIIAACPGGYQRMR